MSSVNISYSLESFRMTQIRLILWQWFFTSLLLTTIVVHSRCLHGERLLLLQLRSSLKFESSFSTKLVSWNQSTDCCSWAGITCDSSGHVIGLDLSDDWIGYGIDNSTSLFNLKYLERLNLANNIFNGTQIPSELGKLSNLTYLNLSYSDFSGQIPVEISHLKRLATLDLSYNFLQLQNPNLLALVKDLKELTDLYLDGVNITAQGHEWCCPLSNSLPNLRVLSLCHCGLSGPIDPSLMKLSKSISVIRLAGNSLSCPIPDFLGKFSNLIELSLRSCELFGIFPDDIFGIPTLQVIDLSYNELLQGVLRGFPHNGSLQNMNLRFTSFTGELPDSIGRLRNLSSIDLADCKFNGLIPSSMENLRHLQYLNLRNNSFKGSIPSWLFVPSVQYIELSNNQFTRLSGDIAHVSAFQLVVLDLSSNRLAGPIPTFFFSLKGLELLSLSSNNLVIDANSTNSTSMSFPRLVELKLASSKLRIFPDFLRHQPMLQHLDLSENEIYGEVPNWIWRHKSLSYLNLSHNYLMNIEAFSHDIPSQLDVIDLHSNQLQGQTPVIPESVQYLDFSSNNFSSMIPRDVEQNLSFARLFSLSNNSLRGSIPQFICNATHLEILDLSNNYLSGIIPSCIIEMSKTLHVLKLGNNKLNGIIPDKFSGECELETFDVNGNQIDGEMPKSLQNCTMLEVLDMGNNMISDHFPCWLETSSYLRVLVLRSNRFTESLECRRNNCTWHKLQILDISSNTFNGNLSLKCFFRWEHMMLEEYRIDANQNYLQLLNTSNTYSNKIYYHKVTVTVKGDEMTLERILITFTSIDLSGNKFHGQIPKEIGDLKALHFLNLSRNAFTGQIPSSLGSLTQLESLDLSLNRLSGRIPPAFADRNFLAYCNFSFNQLTGRIPSSTQFQTFQVSSFMGNKGLCGPPLASCSNPNSDSPSVHSWKSNFGTKIDWNYISSSLGFAVGLGIVTVPLVIWRRWRIFFFDRIDILLQGVLS